VARPRSSGRSPPPSVARRDDDVADLVWSSNAAEYWLLLDQRGWTPARYEAKLVNVWSRTLLA